MFKRYSVNLALSRENPRRYLRIAIRPGALRNLLVLLSLSIGTFALLYFSRPVAAVNRTWDGGGVTNNWSEGANWSGDVAPDPLGNDFVIFDGTSSKNVTINVPVIVIGFQINSPYSGEISQGSSSVTVNGASSQSSGTFTGGSGVIDFNSNFTLSGGTFTASSTTTSFALNLDTHLGGTFNPNGGTVLFDGGGDSFVDVPTSLTLNNVTVEKTGAGRVAIQGDPDTLVVAGAMTLTDGQVVVNGSNATLQAQGDLSIASTFDGGNIILLISGAATRTVTLPAGALLPRLTVDAANVTVNTSGAGAITFTQTVSIQSVAVFTNGAFNFSFSVPFFQSGGTFTGGTGLLDFNSNFTLSGGTFTASSTTTSFAATFTPRGTFAPNGGTVVFDGGGDTGIDLGVTSGVPGSLTLNNVTVNKTAGRVVIQGDPDTLVVAGTLTLTDGQVVVNGVNATLEAQGDISTASTFDGGTIILLISGAATRTVTLEAGAFLPRLTVNAPNVTVNTSGAGAITFTQAVNIQDVLSFTNGTLDFIFNAGVTFTQSGGTFTGGSGLIDFNSTFSLSGGTFTASSTTTSFEATFTKTSGTFAPNGGTVVFDGSGESVLNFSPPLTLNNLTVNKPNNVAVRIDPQVTLVVAGTLTLTNGVFDKNGGASTATLEVQGDVAIASTFDGGSINFRFGASANQVYTNGGGLNFTSSWTVDKAAGAVTLASDLILSSNQPLTITSGTLDQGASFNLQTSNTLTVGANGILRNFGTGDLVLGGNLTNNSGIINFNDGGTNCNDPNGPDPLQIRSTNTTQRIWSGSGTFSLVDVDVDTQTVGATPGTITAFGASNLTNTTGWILDPGCPVITGDPANQSACPGGSAVFNVNAIGTGLNFGWRKGVTPLANGGNISIVSGANTSTLTINPVSAGDVGSYDVVVTNSLGVTAASSPATLSLFVPPSVATNPVDSTLCEGALASFTAAANGDPAPTVQWQVSTDGINFNDLLGATSTTLSFTTSAAQNGNTYRAVFTNTCSSATTTAATLTVNTPPTVSSSPGDTTVCEGALASFTAAADGAPTPTVQWQVSTDGINFSDLAGATSTTLSFTTSAAQNGNKYRAVFTNSCNTATTTAAALTVNTAPAVSANPGDTTACEGALASFTAAANGSPTPTVQWQLSTDGTNFNDIVGATSTTLSFTASASQNGNTYRAVFTNSCSTATTSAATLTADGFGLSANSQTFTHAGGSGSVDVITGSTCSWTAVSNDGFINITSGGGGTGNGTVNFTVDPASSSRTGTMTIAGQTYTVNQAGPTAADGMVSGRILDNNGLPVEGAAVRMSGTQTRLTITDAQGNYRFDNVETAGFYTVTPARVNFTFSPLQRSFSQLGQQTEAAFTASSNGGNLNPLDTTEYLVRQQYVDFLIREPDEAGLNFWVNNIESCGTDLHCREAKRIDTSAAFFLSIEFQHTGYLVYRMYRSAYGNIPAAPVPVRLGDFRADSQVIGRGVVVNKTGWEALLENNKQAFMAEFVQRSRFLTAFPASITPAQFVDTLNHNAGDPLSQSARDQLVNDLTNGVKTRAQVLRALAEHPDLVTAQFNRAFVLMQYFGYLGRNPNDLPEAGLNFDGYHFWLNKLNYFNGNYIEAEMIKAFMTSGEYRQRFRP